MRVVVLLAAISLLGAGCGGRGRRGADAAVSQTQTPSTSPGRVGTIVGVVRLAEGAELPRYTVTQVGFAPDRPPIPSHCTPFRDADTLPVRFAGDGRALDGMMVTAMGEARAFFAALPSREPQDHTVAIDDCRLTPRMVVAMRGDTLVLENRTDEPYMPHVGPTQFYQTLARGEPRRLALDHLDLVQILCGFSLGCGRTDLVVLSNPVFDVTGEDGRFEMTNVPADMPIQIHAWHPLFLDSVVETRVPRGGRVEVELVAQPRSTARDVAPRDTTPQPELPAGMDIPVPMPLPAPSQRGGRPSR